MSFFPGLIESGRNRCAVRKPHKPQGIMSRKTLGALIDRDSLWDLVSVALLHHVLLPVTMWKGHPT